MVTEMRATAEILALNAVPNTPIDAAHLAQFPDFVLGADQREAFDFEPIPLRPGSPNAADLIIKDRGER